MDIVTDPSGDGGGLEEVSLLADTITERASEVNRRDVKQAEGRALEDGAGIDLNVGLTNVSIAANATGTTSNTASREV